MRAQTVAWAAAQLRGYGARKNLQFARQEPYYSVIWKLIGKGIYDALHWREASFIYTFTVIFLDWARSLPIFNSGNTLKTY
jgi:hypothetical protein